MGDGPGAEVVGVPGVTIVLEVLINGLACPGEDLCRLGALPLLAFLTFCGSGLAPFIRGLQVPRGLDLEQVIGD